MSKQILTILFVLTFASTWNVSTVDADLFVAGTPEWEQMTALMAKPTMTAAPATDEREDESEQPRPNSPDQERIAPHVGLLGCSASMSGPSSLSSGNNTAQSLPVILASDDDSTGNLRAYTLQESDLLLPVPFLDGVFRPPKSSVRRAL